MQLVPNSPRRYSTVRSPHTYCKKIIPNMINGDPGQHMYLHTSPPHALLQRWASTLANRSNARHRSNIRAPPRPLPSDVCLQSVGICVARGAGSDSQLSGVSGCHIFVPAPHAPPPKGIGQRLKVVILPTTALLSSCIRHSFPLYIHIHQVQG